MDWNLVGSDILGAEVVVTEAAPATPIWKYAAVALGLVATVYLGLRVTGGLMDLRPQQEKGESYDNYMSRYSSWVARKNAASDKKIYGLHRYDASGARR